MGKNVYTWETVLDQPNPPAEIVGLDWATAYPPLSEAQVAWAKRLKQEIDADESVSGQVLGHCQMAHFPRQLSVLITPDLDVSDNTRFPDEVASHPIVYIRIPPPEPQ